MTQKDIPNSNTMKSLIEAISDIHNPHLPRATNYQELEKILNS